MLDHNLVLKANELFTAGSIKTDGSREQANGLYIRDTRHLNVLALTIANQPVEVLGIVQESMTSATIVGANPYIEGEHPVVPQTVLVTQHVSLDDRLRARVTITNQGRDRVDLPVGLRFGSDFRDLFDIRGFVRTERGEVREPELTDSEARLAYAGLDGAVAATVVSVSIPPTWTVGVEPMPLRNSTLTHLPPSRRQREQAVSETWPVVTGSWHVSLGPAESWQVDIEVAPEPADGVPVSNQRLDWPVAPVQIDDPLVERVFAQSVSDLAALDTTFADGPLIAAGIPWYVAPFGRDSLIAALQTLHITPERSVATLRTMAKLQGTVVDERKEEEPGKIPHEMRYGEMARLGEVPHSPYFGTVDATPLWLWLLAETVAWTGDVDLYQELKPAAERAVQWCVAFGDLDGDGLIEYRTDHHGAGTITHQVWKDSFDSLHHADGSIPAGPIAAVEVQGYAFAGYTQLADCANRYGDETWADELRGLADRVRSAVEEHFWLDEPGFYAQALDGDKRPVATLSSNPGHLLAAGLPSTTRAQRLIDRMVQPDMLTHWGLRTLSSTAPTFNPISYHNGSIWPHDNSLVGYGCYRYGRLDAGDRILAGLIAAAAPIPDLRLPELYCGFEADGFAATRPVAYPVSCSPQAWAAGAIPLLLRGKNAG